MSVAASETAIANLALGHLGVTVTIDDIDVDTTDEATTVRTFYDTVVAEAFRDFNWPFATKFADLGLVEADPTTEWGYSYRYPSDCVFFRRIISGKRNDTQDTRIEYRIGQDATEKLIYTDEKTAVCEYAVIDTDPTRYAPDVVMMISLLLAANIAPAVAAGDPFKLGERARTLYIWARTKAQANALNEQQDQEIPDSSFIRAR